MFDNQFIAPTAAWNDNFAWSTGVDPTVNSTENVEILAGNSATIFVACQIGSVTMDSGSSILIQETNFSVGDTGSGAVLGGPNTSITLQVGAFTGANLEAGAAVTSASGTVYLEGDSPYIATYTWNGGGTPSTVTQVVNMGNGSNGNAPYNNVFHFNTQFDGTITGFQQNNYIEGPNSTFLGDTIGTNTVSETYASGTYTINFSGPVTYDSSNLAVASDGTITTTNTVPCFVTGTMILTASGEVAVEDLRVGDLAVTTSGQHRPIVWIGRRELRREVSDRAEFPAPIRVLAGAFGDHLPVRDLWLSANHAVCVKVVDEVLIPIGALVNGSTVARMEDVDEVTYWHVELQSHDILVADGLPAESYLECSDRRWFRQDGPVREPKRAVLDVATHSCRPFYNTGYMVDAVKHQLERRALDLGWKITSDMDLHMVVDGRRVDPDMVDGEARFQFSPRAREVTLVSETYVPAHGVASGGQRSLGVSIAGLRIDNHQGRAWDVRLDDPCWGGGFHPQEAAAGLPWRWTDGRLTLAPSLRADCMTDVLVYVDFDQKAGRRWIAPIAAVEVGALGPSERAGLLVAAR